jgi:hypothetical protein
MTGISVPFIISDYFLKTAAKVQKIPEKTIYYALKNRP